MIVLTCGVSCVDVHVRRPPCVELGRQIGRQARRTYLASEVVDSEGEQVAFATATWKAL